MPCRRDGARSAGRSVTGRQHQLSGDNIFSQRADVSPRGDTGADADGSRVTVNLSGPHVRRALQYSR
jgi:hypothetical protein